MVHESLLEEDNADESEALLAASEKVKPQSSTDCVLWFLLIDVFTYAGFKGIRGVASHHAIISRCLF